MTKKETCRFNLSEFDNMRKSNGGGNRTTSSVYIDFGFLKNVTDRMSTKYPEMKDMKLSKRIEYSMYLLLKLYMLYGHDALERTGAVIPGVKFDVSNDGDYSAETEVNNVNENVSRIENNKPVNIPVNPETGLPWTEAEIMNGDDYE